MGEYKSSLTVRNSEDSANGYDELNVITKSGSFVEVQQNNHANLLAKSILTDGTNDVTVTNVGTDYALDVNVVEGVNVEVDFDQSNDSVLVYGQDSGGTNQVLSTDTTGQLQIDVISSALPNGASTEAKQDSLISLFDTSGTDDVGLLIESLESKDFSTATNQDTIISLLQTDGTIEVGNLIEDINDTDFATEATLTSIDTKFPAQGQATMSASVPVAVASDQSVLDVNVVGTVSSSPVIEYNTSSKLASGATVDLTFTGFTAQGKVEQIFLSASAEIKAEVQIGNDTDGWNTKRVAFNSPAGYNIDLSFDAELDVPAGDDVKVVVTNRHPAESFNVYADIGGHLV